MKTEIAFRCKYFLTIYPLRYVTLRGASFTGSDEPRGKGGHPLGGGPRGAGGGGFTKEDGSLIHP